MRFGGEEYKRFFQETRDSREWYSRELGYRTHCGSKNASKWNAITWWLKNHGIIMTIKYLLGWVI